MTLIRPLLPPPQSIRVHLLPLLVSIVRPVPPSSSHAVRFPHCNVSDHLLPRPRQRRPPANSINAAVIPHIAHPPFAGGHHARRL
ncbi:hypothetical protein C8R44DRAFT_415467 [Mycena epipterygia]|nr:hypothetical protein C8R44DRAFT_415467 [Mycena epipterygia]